MGVFTKKHFEVIAQCLRKAKQLAPDEVKAAFGHRPDPNREAGLPSGYMGEAGQLGVAVVQRLLMEEFQKDNPTFNPLRFIEVVTNGEQHKE